MKTHITLIPEHGSQGHEYYRSISILEAKGWAVNLLSPPWDQGVGEIVASTQHSVDTAPGDEPILFGHGEGANLALISAANTTSRTVGGLILASTGILCANGLQYPGGRETAEENYPGQQEAIRLYEIETLTEAAGLRPSQVAVLVGEAEAKKHPHIGKLARITADAFDVKVMVIPNAPHIIEYSESYIMAVANAAMNIQVANLSR